MSRPVAVVGVGQTKHAARRSEHSIMGLVREAVDRALADAGLEHKDIDAIVIGKAPDMLEGVAQPEQMLVGALGGHMKPVIRVHTAGSVGASTAITAATHVQSGLYDRVLTVAFEKQSKAMRCGRSPRPCRSRRRSSPAPAASSRRTAARTWRRRTRPRTSAR
jgi:acetyl-CoA C-acetyltransferase